MFVISNSLCRGLPWSLLDILFCIRIADKDAIFSQVETSDGCIPQS